MLKVVYYGPGLGGKTTSLKALHAAVRPEHRGKMISLATPVDRTLYFDFLPVRLPSVGDVQLRLQLFTVPGQVYFNATRKLVLTGADGIVFVADSQEVRLDANIESLDNLRDNLKELGRDIAQVPLVFSYNKRDLPDVLPTEDLDARLNPWHCFSVPTVASTGKGVFEVLDAVVRAALDDLRARKVIPNDVIIPPGGIIAERLSDVQAEAPMDVEPTRIVAGEVPRTLSGQMFAVPVPDGHARPTAAPPAPVASPAHAVHEPPAALTSALSTPTARPASPPPPVAINGAVRRASSLAPLFDVEDQETVRVIEDAIGESILPRAVLLLEALMVRVIERAGRTMGRPDAPHEAIAWALSLPPERYARVRTAAQRARRGGEISRRDALEAYVVVAMAQIAADSMAR